jgi:hypothetical protein
MADRIKLPLTQVEYIQAPTGGWSPDVQSWELPVDQAPVLQNFQIKPGKIRVRPPYRVTADLTSSAVSLAGWIPYKRGTSVLTKRLFTSGYSVEPQNVHRVGTSVPHTGAVATQTAAEDALYEITGSTVTRHSIAGTPGQAPGFRQIDFNGNKYALSYQGPGSAVLAYNDGVTGWEHGVEQITSPSSVSWVTYAPVGGFDIYGWLSRVWVLGGLPPLSAPPASTTALFFSNPIQMLTSTAADWTDPVSGLYNQIDIDGTHSDPGVALASVPAGLIILRQNSVFILRGTDPSSYTLRPVSKQAGCIDARSVVEINSKVYYMSEQGFMVTDGVSVQNLSGTLQDELYRQINTWNAAVFGGTGAWCTADVKSDGNILVSFGTYSAGSAGQPYLMHGAFSCVLNPTTGTWVQVNSLILPVGFVGGPGLNTIGPSIQEYEQFLTLGNTVQLTIEDSSLGLTASSPSSLFDVSTVGGAVVPIAAVWFTRSPNLSLGGRRIAHIKRYYVDYACYTDVSQGGQLTAQLVDRMDTGSLYAKSITVPASNPFGRQILGGDDAHEVADLQVSVLLQGSTGGETSVPIADVHGVGFEFQASYGMPPTV